MKPAPPVISTGPLAGFTRSDGAGHSVPLPSRAFLFGLPFPPRKLLRCVALIQSDLVLKVRRWPGPPDRPRPGLPARPPVPAILLSMSLSVHSPAPAGLG